MEYTVWSVKPFTVKLTLMTKALMKAAGSRILYVLVTRQPPTTVAALLANVNCEHLHKSIFVKLYN